MIDLFFMTSPNVYKICIALEEMGFEYRLIPTDITHRHKLTAEALAGAINGKVPVIVDDAGPDGRAVTIFESGAILHYLAERSGELLPSEPAARTEVMQWLFWQVGALGPFGGQCFHFRALAPAIAPEVDNTYARNRFAHILSELWAVMDRRLADRPYLAGDYSIADVACYPWIVYVAPDEGQAPYPNVIAWLRRVGERPGVVRAYERSRRVDMGRPRDALDTMIMDLEDVRRAVTL